jgi:hypothetical protein
MPGALATLTLVAALEVARGACERELLLFRGHCWQVSDEVLSPCSLEYDLAFALLAMLVDE